MIYEFEFEFDYVDLFLEDINEADWPENQITKEPEGDVFLHLNPKYHNFFTALSHIFQSLIQEPKCVDCYGNVSGKWSIYFTKTWITRLKANNDLPRHVHIPYHFSWCYYLKTEEKEKPLMIEMNAKVYSIQPKPKVGILFPSHLPHWSKSIDGQDERIIICGDIILCRPIDSYGCDGLTDITQWKTLAYENKRMA